MTNTTKKKTVNKVEAEATSEAETKTKTVAVSTKITALIAERKGWESNELAHSNKRLYEILTSCYRLYKELRGKTKLINQVDKLLSTKGINFQVNTSLPSKIVKLVFGGGRRRNSVYSVAIRRAHKDGVKPENLTAWIAKMGGVDDIRLNGTSVKQTENAQERRSRLRGYAVNTIVTKPVLGSLPKQEEMPDAEDGVVLCMGLVQPNGSINIVQFVDKSLVPAALEKLGRKIEQDGKAPEAFAAEKKSAEELDGMIADAMPSETAQLDKAA